jgi:DNA polymerase-3 subunit gamma/tau
MQAVMASFPGAKILSIRTPEEIAAAAVSEALPEVEDEWDPFEDD